MSQLTIINDIKPIQICPPFFLKRDIRRVNLNSIMDVLKHGY